MNLMNNQINECVFISETVLFVNALLLCKLKVSWFELMVKREKAGDKILGLSYVKVIFGDDDLYLQVTKCGL